MATHDTAQLADRHRLLADIGHPRMAKAELVDVRKADVDWKLQMGKVIERVQGPLLLKEFADAIDRDERQVKRWIDGKERPHFDAIFAVDRFRTRLVVALAELSHDVDITTTLTIRRTA
jgi:hypothetical protein